MMASQGGVSRLAQMQMRFQQKQQQERELRKMEMTGSKPQQEVVSDATITAGIRTVTVSSKTKTASLSSSLEPGKVRQMFNERRHGAGIDRSKPLKPITTKLISSGNGNIPSPPKIERVKTTSELIHQAIRNGGSDLNLNENTLISHTFPSNNNNSKILDDELFPEEIDGFGLTTKIVGNMKADSNNNPGRGSGTANIKLKPVVTKKIPPALVRTPKAVTKPIALKKSPPPMRTPILKATPVKTTRMAATTATKSPPPRSTNTPPPGTVECKICKRFFNQDRIAKHEVICEKSVIKKRKPFDATKHRVKGTDAEKFIKKKPTAGSRAPKTSTTEPSTVKKSTWRTKHEEFINAIRAAKEVQAHLAKGGKLSDLPPPPPSENPDYIQCPHCSRRFNESAATRHIPKCATMLHNKPKPAAKKK